MGFSAESQAQPSGLAQITSLLKSLSDELVANRLDQPESVDLDAYLSASAPLFSALQTVNRDSQLFSIACKARTQEARLKMDDAHLRLQNLLFEQNHLEREIRKCEEFESEYQNLPLLPLGELVELANSSNPPASLPVPLPEDPHELMLVRLNFELAERKRLDEEKKELGAQKTKLVRENEVKKARLEDLEKQLDDFVANARTIQTKMHVADALHSSSPQAAAALPCHVFHHFRAKISLGTRGYADKRTTFKLSFPLTSPTGFVSGALAACTAVTVTNPFEVVKTRLQLDGELQGRRGAILSPATVPLLDAKIPVLPPSLTAGPSGRVYTGPLDCAKKTWKFEGVKGVQRGLGAAYTYQIALNGSRLGFYEPLRQQINKLAGYSSTDVVAWTSIGAGASSGIVGAIFGNPLFLVKARMQAYSPFNPVGAQHQYDSVLHAFRTIVKADGFKGLARGVDAAMLRTAMGSSAQLPAYNLAKTKLKDWGLNEGVSMYFLASTFSGACVCAVMQPADTALTRMYNQAPNSTGPDGKPRGLLYKNPIDCLYKTWKVEGVRGWYKGTTAHLMRIAPHTVITLVANEFISRKYLAWRDPGEGRD